MPSTWRPHWSIGADLEALFSYVDRLTAAAVTAGLHVLAPD